MSMGRRTEKQQPLWVAAGELPQSPGHRFYEKLNELLGEADFDRKVEALCRAFYEADNGGCAVSAVVYNKTDAETGQDTAARVRVRLNPREMVHIDSADNETMSLQCGDSAKTLMVVDRFIAAGAAD